MPDSYAKSLDADLQEMLTLANTLRVLTTTNRP